MSGGTITPEARVGNVPIQQSAQGFVVPLVYGKNRVGVNLVWYADFESVEKRQSQGGKGGVDTIAYSYYAAIIGAVGQGPLTVSRVWRAQQKYLASEIGEKLGLEWHGGAAGQGVWTWLQSKHAGTHDHLGGDSGGYAVTGASGDGTTVTLGFANQPSAPFAVGSEIIVGGFDPASYDGTYTVDSCTTNTVSFSSPEVASIVTMGSVYSTRKTLVNEDIGYSKTAYLASTKYALDQGAQIPNHTVEVINDATGPAPLPMVVVLDLLKRCGIDTSIVQAAGVNEYATALGITCSPAITSATATADLIEQLAVINNVGVVPSEGKLKFVPYAAESISTNIVTVGAFGGQPVIQAVSYTPNTTPAYDLTDDDFVAPGGDPISVTRKSEADTYNHVQCEYADVQLDYNTSVTEAKDDESIARSGLRTKDKITLLGVTDANVARLVAQQVLQREIAVRNQYEFTLTPRHVLLEPMDFVTITDSLLGFDKLVVRITEVVEQEDGTLKVKAEDAPLSAFNPAKYAYQSNAGFIANYNVTPGDVAAPTFFEPPSSKTTTGLEVWCAVSGQSKNWGGCDVYVSMDGTNYKFDQAIERGSRYGVLADGLRSLATDGLSIVLNGLGGQLLSGSAADAAALNTLCWVGDEAGGEFLSYETATLLDTNTYELSGLLRGAYDTGAKRHLPGASFVRVDSGIAKSEPLDAAMVGKTIYFKFCSFNIYGARKQGLADVRAFAYTIKGNMLRLAETGVALNPSWSPQTIAVPTKSDGSEAVTGQTAALTLYVGEVKVPFGSVATDADMPVSSVRVSSATPSAGLSVGLPSIGATSATWTVTGLTSQQSTLTVVLRYKNSVGNVFDVGATVQVTQLRSGQAGAAGISPPTIDINGFTGFSVNAGGLISPATATLQALVSGITSASYSWAITGATPSAASTASVTITPQAGVSSITAALTVTAPGLSPALTKTVVMPVVYSGQPGQAGQNGVQSAYPSIYQWTGSATPPARPTTTSTYNWATAAFTPPSGWSILAPNNTTPGQYLWELTVPLAVSATTTSSTLDWTNASYAIRNVAYNGVNGANGANGINGSDGTNGANGSATYLVTRSANDSSAPTFSETYSAIGRYPTLGDIAVINYNGGNASVQYRYTATGYVQQVAYMTGSLIVQNTITGDKIVANSLSVDRLSSGSTTGLTGGSFGLGGGETLNGYPGTGRFSANTAGRFAVLAIQENTNDGNGAIAGAHLGSSGYGGAFYSSFNTNYNSFYTAAALGGGISGGIFKLNRSVGSANNLGLLPVSELQGGTDDCGAYVASYGYTASSAVTQVFLGNKTTLSAMVARRYSLDGSTLLSEVYVARDSYAVEAYQKKIYSSVGYAPFTGVHDGIIPEAEGAEVGDIVVDHAILKRIDISNAIAEFRRSSQSNQVGAIGVLAMMFDEPPADWYPLPDIPEPPVESQQTEVPTPKTGQANIGDFQVPVGMKVVHINALGEGLINVCGEGGDIQVGDLIVSSGMPGKGMKQADEVVRNYTVAKARESAYFDSETQVRQIACIYLAG